MLLSVKNLCRLFFYRKRGSFEQRLENLEVLLRRSMGHLAAHIKFRLMTRAGDDVVFGKRDLAAQVGALGRKCRVRRFR